MRYLDFITAALTAWLFLWIAAFAFGQEAPVLVTSPVERSVLFVFPDGATRCAFLPAGEDPLTATVLSELPVFELVPGQRCGFLSKPTGAESWGALVEVRCRSASDTSWSPIATHGGAPAQIRAYPYQPGDVNEDGEVDIVDDTVLRRKLAGLP